MKTTLVVLLLLLISCVKPSPTSSGQKAEPTAMIQDQSQEMPTLKIELADRACEKDSDCDLVPTQCSCSCGEGVSKSKASQYVGQLEDLCKSYQGKMCKKLCKGEVMCKNRLCTYVYR